MTAAEFQEKHLRRTVAASADMRAGVDRITVSPTEQAAAKQEKMISRLTESVRNGKWARGLRAVTLTDWKTKMLDVGVGRVAGGLEAAAAKVQSFAAQFLPFVEGVQAKVRKMPDLTLQDNLNRMITNATDLSKFEKK